jgi:hypothetical protein
MGCQEALDGVAYLGGMGLESEMAGIEQNDLRLRQVTTVSQRAGRQEMGVVAPPDGQQGRRMRTEIAVEGRIKRQIAGVIQDQVKLDLVGARRAM